VALIRFHARNNSSKSVKRRAYRFRHIAVVGGLAGLVAAAANPPEEIEETLAASPSALLFRASQLRLAALKPLSPPDAEILIWQARPEVNEVRIAFAKRISLSATYAPTWDRVTLIVDRMSLPGLLVAEAVEPLAIPARGAGVRAWNRWMADSRVKVRLFDRATILEEGWIPRLAGRNAPPDPQYICRRWNRAPVDPCWGR
jgi:hypothetical protein